MRELTTDQDEADNTHQDRNAVANNETAASATAGDGAAALADSPLPGFDISKFRISQDFEQAFQIKKVITVVPVRKPTRQEFIRVNPAPEWRLTAAALTLKEERETYLVVPELLHELPGDAVPMLMLTTVNRQGATFIWPLRLPGADGKLDSWSRSAQDAAQYAESGWVKMAANMSIGGYDLVVAQAKLPEPTWPDAGFERLIEIAFRDRIIRDLDHPVVRRLRGVE